MPPPDNKEASEMVTVMFDRHKRRFDNGATMDPYPASHSDLTWCAIALLDAGYRKDPARALFTATPEEFGQAAVIGAAQSRVKELEELIFECHEKEPHLPGCAHGLDGTWICAEKCLVALIEECMDWMRYNPPTTGWGTLDRGQDQDREELFAKIYERLGK